MNSVRIVTYIVYMAIAFLIFFGVIAFINKVIRHKEKALSIKSIIIGWVAVLIINVICVVANLPFGIGIYTFSRFDGAIDTYYVSLGYTVHVNNPNKRIKSIDEPKDPINTEFVFNIND